MQHSQKYTNNSWYDKGPFKALVASGRMKRTERRSWMDHLDQGVREDGTKEFVSHPYMSLQDAVLNCQDDFNFLLSVGWQVSVSEQSEYNEATIRISIVRADEDRRGQLAEALRGRIEALTVEVKELKEKWLKNCQDSGGKWLNKSAELDSAKVSLKLLQAK